MRVFILLLIVLIAFAGNSVLARAALDGGTIGPWSYTSIRFVSGALMLLVLAGPKAAWRAGRWRAAVALCLYGVCFSYAYLALPTGTGALLLFASVQLTMLAVAMHRGERLTALKWGGLIIAMAGLVWLLAPGIGAPSPIHAAIMVASGVGWGAYSVWGKTDGNAVARTAGHFARAAILLGLASVPLLLVLPERPPTPTGIGLAIISGTVTSALGYALWYRVLHEISVTTAAVSQLSVPVIAALGGALFVFEPITLPFALACAVVLTGVGLATVQRR